MVSPSTIVRGNSGAALLVAALTLPFFAGCGKEPEGSIEDPVRAVKLLTLESPLETLGREFPGRVKATTAADLAFRVSGPLVEIPVEAGDAVAQGDIIARIDERDFKTKRDQVNGSLAEANSQLEAMQTGARPEDIAVLKAGLEAAEAKFIEADRHAKRLADLFAEDVGTRADMEKQEKTRDVAKADRDAAQQRLNAGMSGARKEDVEAMEARIEGLKAQSDEANAALSDATLRAPFAGVIALKYVSNRENIRMNQRIVSLQDLSAIEIEIQVSETAMARASSDLTIRDLAESLELTVEFPAIPGEQFSADLKNYEVQADPVTQTFAVTLIMPPPPGIQPGMNATVYGTVREGVEVREVNLFVPVHAVFSDVSGESHVWKVDPETMRVSAHPVAVGALAGGNVEVLNGLSVGDTIATSAANSLREGDKVRGAQLGRAN